MAWKHMAYNANKSDIGHTRWKQHLMKNTQIDLVSQSKSTDEIEKKKKKKKDNFKVLGVTQKRNIIILFLLYA